uniref:Transcription regulator protein BACH1-like n=1 Tax=Poecilia formosa TaxID=48698 RepID=A0A096M1V2_POEFO
MAGLAPRSSVFTFESTVHSSQVLHRLNEQRCRDMLCDVTVLVEGQSFRAHRSVLASCSEYFLQKISSPTQHGAVITLPEEVTLAGFEPLLQFAYTSKLNFGKDNVLEIRSSASILGFRDLDEACFDFLLPKFFLSRNGSAPIVRKTCCRKECKRRLSKENSATDSDDVLLDDKEVKPVADSSPKRDVTWDYNKSVSNKMGSQNSTRSLGAEGKNEPVIQGPKYRKFQLACEKGMFASEKCSFNSAVSEIRNGFALSCLSCPNKVHCEKQTTVDLTGNPNSNKCIESKAEVQEVWKTEKHNVKSENCESKVVVDISKEEKTKIKTLSPKPSPILCERSSLPFCPLMCLGVDATITQSMGNEKCAVNNTESKTSRVSGAIISCSSQQNEIENSRERSTVKKETADHLREQFRFSKDAYQQNFLDCEAGCSTDACGECVQGSSLQWSNLASTKTGCPFYQDFDQMNCPMFESEGTTQSSVNSGEDGDSETETEGDSEFSTAERALQVQLPFSVDWIVNLNRNDFQQLLKQQVLTQEQLEFVHDIRRRSKNRLAAQRCRKRKLDCIYNLQCEINKLKTEREKLILERSRLSQRKMETCHTVNALCRRVCSEANLHPDQLQVLASCTSSDCPLSSLVPQIDALLSQHGSSLHPKTSASQEDTLNPHTDTST